MDRPRITYAPGSDLDEPDTDPIQGSNDLKDAVDFTDARAALMRLCEADLRYLDARAHLGNLVFDRSPKEAIRHHGAGVRVGELSLGRDFDGVLSWGFIDNRPFLRCMQGFGLCLWRFGRFEEAPAVGRGPAQPLHTRAFASWSATYGLGGLG